MKVTLLMGLIAVLLFRCKEGAPDSLYDGPEPDNWVIDSDRVSELKGLSSDSIIIQETTLELQVSLSRDFQTFSPPNGKNLISLNRLVDVDSIKIPDGVRLAQQYVMHGDSLWEADYTDEIRQPAPYVLERFSNNGPKWGPHIRVTIVAKVIDNQAGSEHYLRRENQMIGRTD